MTATPGQEALAHLVTVTGNTAEAVCVRAVTITAVNSLASQRHKEWIKEDTKIISGRLTKSSSLKSIINKESMTVKLHQDTIVQQDRCSVAPVKHLYSLIDTLRYVAFCVFMLCSLILMYTKATNT